MPDEVIAGVEPWIRLVHHSGLGRASLRRLLAAFGSPQAVLDATPEAVHAAIGARAAAGFGIRRDEADAAVEAVDRWLVAYPGRRVLALGDPDYPPMLLQSADPPLLLYVEGRIESLGRRSLAIVGSRRATPQGLQNARAFGKEMAERGWTIVSGLASGIDSAAHEGALDAGGLTVAVVGTGVDVVYPRSNRPLAQRIIGHGALLSEYPLGTPPIATHFPQRNRIIATLTHGTLVVEAALQSGSLITARLAAEAGREVFAIPGSIHSPQARGCHALIRQGAKLVETAEDLIEELGDTSSPAEVGAVSGPGIVSEDSPSDPVMRALGHDPVSLDALMARCGWPAPELNARLLELELDGQVARLPGGLFQRVQRA